MLFSFLSDYSNYNMQICYHGIFAHWRPKILLTPAFLVTFKPAVLSRDLFPVVGNSRAWKQCSYSEEFTLRVSLPAGLQTLAPLPESWQHQRGGEGQRQPALWFGQHCQLRPAEQDGQAAARKPLQCPHHGELCCNYRWLLKIYVNCLVPESFFVSMCFHLS